MRYLSPGWLSRLPRAEPAAGEGAVLTLRHVVEGAPGGEARYDILLRPDGPWLTQCGDGGADVTFRTDYETASAIASGALSTQAALAGGRLKVSGDLGALAGMAPSLSGVDVLPPAIRDETDFEQ